MNDYLLIGMKWGGGAYPWRSIRKHVLSSTKPCVNHKPRLVEVDACCHDQLPEGLRFVPTRPMPN